MEKNKKAESRLPDLFVGPLGKAQLNAIKFSEGIASHDAKMKLVEKMNDLNALLENENTTKSQAVVAEALLEEISHCFFALFEGWDDERTFH